MATKWYKGWSEDKQKWEKFGHDADIDEDGEGPTEDNTGYTKIEEIDEDEEVN